MVTILLECGLRIGELCALPTDFLICDDRHEWYLSFYQPKLSQEHVIPVVEEKIVGAIQAQQQEVPARLGKDCPYLFPNPRFSHLLYKEPAFAHAINKWAVEARKAGLVLAVKHLEREIQEIKARIAALEEPA